MRPWPGGGRTRRFGRGRALVVALYCFIVLFGGFFHHDLACHLKSPTHCTTCAFSLSSAGVPTVGGMHAVILQKAGPSFRELQVPRLAAVVVRINDRSPPTA